MSIINKLGVSISDTPKFYQIVKDAEDAGVYKSGSCSIIAFAILFERTYEEILEVAKTCETRDNDIRLTHAGATELIKKFGYERHVHFDEWFKSWNDYYVNQIFHEYEYRVQNLTMRHPSKFPKVEWYEGKCLWRNIWPRKKAAHIVCVDNGSVECISRYYPWRVKQIEFFKNKKTGKWL